MNINSNTTSSSSNYSHSQRAEAERWLNIAQKLLTARDLHGTKTFAIRARESDPRLDSANQILAVVDTLLAAESRINNNNNTNNQFDWYAILQLARLTHSIELVASQYRKLALLLSPERNRLPFADQAFKLVCDAWSVLSNPSKKEAFDTELQLTQLSQLGQQTPPPPQPPPPATATATTPVRRSARTNRDDKVATEEPERRQQTESTRASTQSRTRTESTRTRTESEPEQQQQQPSFWTACPYCYILYEYPKVYEECTLRCQNCKRAFHGAMIESPPVTTGNSEYFCCWGYFPLGFNSNAAKEFGGKSSNWSPISNMFTVPFQANNVNVGKQKKVNNNNSQKSSAPPRVYYDDDEVYVEISDTSEDSNNNDDDDDGEWEGEKRKKKAKNVKGKESGRRNVGSSSSSGGLLHGGVVLGLGNAETNKRGLVGSSGRKQMAKGMKDLGKLDLNVEFSNEVEDPVPGMSGGNGNREEDNVEGNAFFEGLDEFLSSLPILNVVGDDKLKAT